jgi:tetratricopeptide (TPR) repeat protein
MATPDQRAANTYYNQLVEGFQAGQLSLKVDVPDGLAQLANPYDPNATAQYRTTKYALRDLSYYKGKAYLYFGVTPALLLFWPFAALTGRYLYDGQAVVIFCALGFLGSVAILCAVRRRYFPDVSVWILAASALALGLATGVPMLLPRSNVYEVAISCAYMLTMLALGAIYGALHQMERRRLWMVVASIAYGLALGARPTLAFGAIILLAPVVQAWREQRTVWPLLAAATVPITLIGSGLMLYNQLRFDSPFEFGLHYQLLVDRQVTQKFFSLRFLWFNFRVYFLEPFRWGRHFPFVCDIAVPHLPAGHGSVEHPFGILCNTPVVWLALALPLAWRGRTRESALLHGFIAAAASFWGVCVLIIGLYYFTADRFEAEILPTLVLLAVIGILGLERALTEQPCWRRAARWGWGLLLAFSVAFNLLASVKRCANVFADVYSSAGASMQEQGKMTEALELYQQALRIDPDDAEAHCNLGAALAQTGKIKEAIAQYELALQIRSEYAEANCNLGVALAQTGKIEEAIAQYELALQIRSEYAEAHNNLGFALAQIGKIEEAIAQYEQALRIKPDYIDAHNNLGLALEKLGRTPEAIELFQQALRIDPDSVTAHVDLGNALLAQGKPDDAIRNYEQALRINPNDAKAHYNFGLALAQVGRAPEAIEQWEQTLRINPNDADAHYNLGFALALAGRGPEAMEQWKQTLRTNPDDAEAHMNLGLTLERLGRTPEAIEQYQQALKLRPDLTAASNALARLQAGQ